MCSCHNPKCRKHSLAMSLYGAVNVATSNILYRDTGLALCHDIQCLTIHKASPVYSQTVPFGAPHAWTDWQLTMW